MFSKAKAVLDQSKSKVTGIWHLITQPLQRLYLAQFFSAFADNVIFFVLVGMLQDQGMDSTAVGAKMDFYQAMFLLSFVLFAPIVGAFAERNPKTLVLLAGNGLKGIGVALLFLGLPPGFCYFLVGVGAVVYSPAKYGMLVELTDTPDKLMKANGRLEGYTILAILSGSAVGGLMADWLRPDVNLLLCLMMYVFSFAWGYWIPRIAGNPEVDYKQSFTGYFQDVRQLLQHPTTRFALIGTSGFWMISSVLRLAMIVWLAEQLSIDSPSIQSAVVACTAVGIVAGSLLAPRLITMDTFYRAIVAGGLLCLIVMLTVFSPSLWMLVPLLLIAGTLGGMYIVPFNARLQQDGKKLIGTGKVIAIQNFFENTVMIIGIGLLTLLKGQFSISITLVLMAGVLLLIILYLVTQLRHVIGDRRTF